MPPKPIFGHYRHVRLPIHGMGQNFLMVDSGNPSYVTGLLEDFLRGHAFLNPIQPNGALP
jgi:hypothetical protein